MARHHSVAGPGAPVRPGAARRRALLARPVGGGGRGWTRALASRTARFVARRLLQHRLIHRHHHPVAVTANVGGHIRPRDDDASLADTGQATHADDGLPDAPGLWIDQQAVDLANILALGILDSCADDLARLHEIL